jgi:hypothetical protein
MDAKLVCQIVGVALTWIKGIKCLKCPFFFSFPTFLFYIFFSYLLHVLFSFPLFLSFSFYFPFLFISFFLSNLLHVFFSFSLFLSFSLSLSAFFSHGSRTGTQHKHHGIHRCSACRPVLLRSASNPAVSLQLPCASAAVPTSASPDPRRREPANSSVPLDPAASSSARRPLRPPSQRRRPPRLASTASSSACWSPRRRPATSSSAPPPPALDACGLQLRPWASRAKEGKCGTEPQAERGSYDFQLPPRRTAPVTAFPSGFSAGVIFLAPLARLRAK